MCYEAITYVLKLKADYVYRPCYVSLKNSTLLKLAIVSPATTYPDQSTDVSTTEMQLSCQEWKPATEDFVPHHQLATYLQQTARSNGILDLISFKTR